jgi:hypothetical protein
MTKLTSHIKKNISPTFLKLKFQTIMVDLSTTIVHNGRIWNICVTNDHGYVPLVVNTSRSFPHSRLITGFVTRLTRRVPLVEQELPTLPEHMSSPPVFSGARVTRSLVLYVCFVDRCLSFCTFSFGQAKKKICVFTVTRPTLFFSRRP